MNITPEDIKSAIRFSNFSQYFKSLIWQRVRDGNQLSEAALDEIAHELFDKYVTGSKEKAPDAQPVSRQPEQPSDTSLSS